jgi:hypothetical protein
MGIKLKVEIIFHHLPSIEIDQLGMTRRSEIKAYSNDVGQHDV